MAPRSGWTVALASAALDVNRPREAIEVLERAGLEALGPTRDHGWSLLTVAYHMVGDYRGELEATERGIQVLGLDWDFAGPGVRALAALGRTDALTERIDALRAMPPTPYGAPRGAVAVLAAATELRAHGFGGEARRLVARALAHPGGPPSADRPLDRAVNRAGTGPSTRSHDGAEAASERIGEWLRLQTLYEMGLWNEARRRLEAVPPGSRSLPHRGLEALLAARAGDTETARRIDSELAAADRPYDLGETTAWRARIAAVLGEDDRAVELVRRALAEGRSGQFRTALHVLRDFDALRERPDFRRLY
jgi:tetratricopeptide (TPR) repeat protein